MEISIAIERTLSYIEALPDCELDRSPEYIIHTILSFSAYYQEVEKLDKVLDCFDLIKDILVKVNAESKLPDLLLEVHYNMASFFLSNKDYGMARRHFEKYLAVARKLNSEDIRDGSLIKAYGNLAYFYLNMKNHIELSYYLNEMEKEIGFIWKQPAVPEKIKFEVAMHAVDSYSKISATFYEMGQYRDSLKFLKRSLDMCGRFVIDAVTKEYIHDILHIMSTIHQNLSLQEIEIGNRNEAIHSYELLVNKMISFFGEDNVEIAPSLYHMGLLYLKDNRYLDAIEMGTQALELYNKSEQTNHEIMSQIMILLAKGFIGIRDFSAAKSCLHKGFSLYDNSNENTELLHLNFEMGNAELLSGEVMSAVEYFRNAFALLENKQTSALFKEVTYNLTNALMNSSIGGYDEVELILTNIIKTTKIDKSNPPTETLIMAYCQLAKLFDLRNNFKQSENQYQNLFKLFKKYSDLKKTPMYSKFLIEYGIHLYKRGGVDKSKSLFEDAKNVIEKLEGNYKLHSQLALINYWIGLYYSEKSKYEKAGEYFSRSLKEYNSCGETHTFNCGKVLLEYGKTLYLRKDYWNALRSLEMARQALSETFPLDAGDDKNHELSLLEEMIRICSAHVQS